MAKRKSRTATNVEEPQDIVITSDLVSQFFVRDSNAYLYAYKSNDNAASLLVSPLTVTFFPDGFADNATLLATVKVTKDMEIHFPASILPFDIVEGESLQVKDSVLTKGFILFSAVSNPDEAIKVHEPITANILAEMGFNPDKGPLLVYYFPYKDQYWICQTMFDDISYLDSLPASEWWVEGAPINIEFKGDWVGTMNMNSLYKPEIIVESENGFAGKFLLLKKFDENKFTWE